MQRWMITGILTVGAIIAMFLAPQLQGRWLAPPDVQIVAPQVVIEALPLVVESTVPLEAIRRTPSVLSAPPMQAIARPDLTVIPEARLPIVSLPAPKSGPTFADLTQVHPIHPAGESHNTNGCRLPVR